MARCQGRGGVHIPLSAFLVDETGKVVEPVKDSSVNLFFDFPCGAFPQPDCPLLNTIDEYDKTVFDGGQCGIVLQEVALLRRRANTPTIAASLDELGRLAQRAQAGAQFFLEFLGD